VRGSVFDFPFEPDTFKRRPQDRVHLFFLAQERFGSDVVLGKISNQPLAQKKGITVSTDSEGDKHNRANRQDQ